MSAPPAHEFKPPVPGDLRSPCPALNSLANHSYLPHDGKDISFLTAFRALRAGYNLSWPLAFLLSFGTALLIGRGALRRFSLADLAAHNVIEHDGSLSRADATGPVAPTQPDAARMASLLGDGETLGLDDLAKVRAARDAELLALGKPLSGVHTRIARGEVALAYAMFADAASGKVPVELFRTWFGGDRLPYELGWTPPATPQGLLATQKLGKQVAALAAKEKTD
ncbi:heme-thiolate peroxidase [Auricularia subglabra TFB-10046 SS5]|nr:heme-thiolate peroxidase [Auricularia subglabra TFB-10046 SS5]